ncbi:filamentous hemagglutinin N-terminal domain-containing protein [Microbulbifer sp. CnH-101-G]|uniref:filamentous hemagglutinin N-terminal domain-containing protein n=1 Tax=Microbulbifer sp. CnH-101-G TaxID=3243393 RepID=UPI00403A490E
MSPVAYAGPEGGVVTGGKGTIDVDGKTTTIDQTTDLLSIDWDSFNLSPEELVKFLQPDSSSIVLNRILGQDPSTIHGSIEANGHVILVNPRGVLFTETATVNVGAITASGLDMSPEDFMNGDFIFQGEDGSSGIVVNRGVINASSALLVGKQVTNASSGLISAELVSLAAADEAILTFDADGLIGLKVTKEVMENELGVDSAVLNKGAIEGAQVLMEASVSGDLFTAAVNNEGTVKAQGIDTSGGKIRLFGSGGSVANSGTLDASGKIGGEVVLEGDSTEHTGKIIVKGNSGHGGYAAVLGDEVFVAGDIDARGVESGGEVLIGGDYQGVNPEIRNAEFTTVTEEANINASGIGNADGGKVVVWADNTTEFAGTILAESGAAGGDGGFVETSGKQYLQLDEEDMFVSTLSHGDGKTGDWLLDPGWMEISASCTVNCISVTAVQDALANNNVEISVTDANTASGPDGAVTPSGDDPFSDGIFVADSIAWDTAHTLTLTSFNGVQIDTGVTVTGVGGLTIDAGGSFTNLGTINVSDFFLSVGINPFDNNQITNTDNLLGNIQVTNSGIVVGGSGTDTFTLTDTTDLVTVTGTNAFLVDAISFTGVEGVNLGDGLDSVTGADGADWTLTGTNNEAINSGITFSEVESLTAVNANLLGTSGTDAFVLQSNGDVEAYGLSINGMSAVDGNGGDDSLDASAYSDGLALTGTNNQVTAGSLTFDGIVSAITAALTGTNNADSFTVDGSNAASSYGIAFIGVSSINALDGSDSVVGADGADWTLTGTSKEAINSGITFSAVESLTAVNANLLGTSGTDAFVLQSDGDVEAYDLSVSGMSAVDGNGGDDSLDASAYSDGLALTGTNNQVTAGSLTFDGIVSAITAALTGTSGDDAFVITGNNALDVADISFSGLSSVDAGTGTDSVTALGVATLTGVDNEASTSLIDFSGIDSVSGGSLEGSANADTFVVISNSNVTANNISFTGFGSTIDTKGGTDSVTGADGADWTLTGNSKQASNSGITFYEVESLTAVNANLLGTSGTDVFVLQSDGDVEVYDLSISGMSAVDGNGGDDSLDASAYSDGLALTGTNNQVSAGSLTFDGIVSAVTTALTGTSGDDAFVITGSNALDVADISFSGLGSVDAGNGTDSVTALGVVTLTGVDNEASTSLIDFSGIDSVSGGSLEGSANADTFVVISNSNVTANNISFTGFGSTINAKGGNDSVTGADGADWTLTGNSNEASNSGITFSEVESLTAVNANLFGTSGTDAFVLQSDGDVGAYDLSISGMSAVDGNGGDDSLDAHAYSDGLALTGTNNQVSAGSMTFDGIVSAITAALSGTSNADSFTVDGSNAASSYGIAFTGVSSIHARGGSDSVIGADGADWTLTGTSKQASNSGITFSKVESLTAVNANLFGTSGTDAFVLQSDGDVEAYNLSVSGMSAVDGNGGDDSLDASAYSDGLALTGTNNQVSAGSLTFDGIVSAITAALTGTNNADSFTVDGSNAASSYGIAFTGVSSINALDGSDSVIGADGADWTLTGTSKEAINSGITFSAVESLTAVNANLLGTSGTDAFVLQSDGDVEAYDLSVSGMSAVDGNGGDDSLDASAYSDGLALTGTSNQVTAGSLTFDGIVSAITAALTGTNNADSFTVDGSNAASSYGIAFTGVSSINALDGSDSVIGADGADWSLTGTSKEAINNGITFSAVESLTAVNANLFGTSGTDAFVLQSDGDVEAYDLSVSGMSAVDGNGGDDSLDARAYSDGLALTGTNNQVSAGSLTFDGIVSAITAVLTGTSGDDAFVITGSNALDVADISFSGLSSVDAGTGTDSVAALGVVTLTGVDNEASTSLIDFSGIDSVSGGSLEGSANADTFVVISNSNVTANNISFTGFGNTIDAKGGSDSVTGADGADWALTGNSNEASNSGITFSAVESLTAVNANLLGTSGTDAFVLQSDGDVEAYDLSVSGMSAVDGNGGDDSLDASAYSDGLALTGTNNQVTAGSLTFDGIVSAITAALTGTSNADSFTVDGSNAASSYGIAFTGVSSINALDGSDSVVGADGADWTLTGTSKEAINSGITFSAVESLTAVNGNLFGTSGTDAFVLQSDGDVEAYDLSVSGMSAVDGNGGDDSLDASAYSDGLALTGTNNQVSAGSLTFDGIVSAITAALTGTNNADSFTVDGSNAASSYGIAFTGVSSINALDGRDSVVGADGADWTLTGTSKEAINSGITFSAVESLTAVNANLLGTSGTDAFVLQSDGDVEAYDLSVSGMSAVDGNGGDDNLDASAYSDGLALTGTNNQVSAGSLTFDGIVSAITAALTGTSGDDAFVITGNNALDVADISFSGLSSVDAGTGTDSVAALGVVTLTGNSQEATTSLIAFSGIEAVSGGSLEASDADDTFEITGLNALTANDIAFSSISSVDAKGGSDSVIGADGADWTLTGTSKQASNSGITFSEVESLTAVNANLLGTSGTDAFVLQSDGDVEAYDLSVSGMSAVDGNGGDDSLDASAYSDGLALTGTNNQVSAGSLTFDGIVSAITAALTGTSGDDAFVITGNNALDVADISFSGLSSVDAGTGTDSVAALGVVTLTGVDNEASTSLIDFSGIDSVSGGSLEGSANADTFVVISNSNVTANNISFTGFGNTIDAKGGSDSVTGADGADWALTGNSNEASNSGITFSAVESLTAVNANLLGTSGTDAFVLQSDGDVEAYDLSVSGMSAVDGNGGDDSLDASAYSDGLALTGTNNQVSAGSLTFDGIVSAITAALTGTNNADSFTVDGSNAASSYGIAFTGVSSINALDGSDSVIGADGADWTLTGTSKEAINSGITFSAVESLTAVNANLLGTSGTDAFVLQSDGDVEAYDLSVSGMSAVDGNGGDDSLDASAYSDGLALTGTSNQVTAGSLTFDGIVSAITAALTGTSNADSFTVDGSNAASSYGIAFTGVSSINALDGSDSVIGADGADWSLTGTSKEAINNGITFSAVESLTAVNANLFGTSGTDAFVLQSDGDVEAYDLSVSGMSAVDGNGGDDSLDARAYSDGLALTGTNNQVSAGSLTFDGIVSAITAVLTGTSGDDAFVITGSNALDVADISFSGLSSVDAGTGTDSVAALGVVTLTGVDNEASTSLIDFSGIDSVSGGSLEGSANADTFVVISNSNVTANNISFTGFGNTIDAKGGSDSVTGADGADWALTGNSNEASNSGITFSAVESLTAVNANLLGTSGTDAFVLQSDGDVEAYDLSVSGMSAVDGNGGDDSLDASTYSDGLALTGTNNQVTAGSLTLDGIVSAITAALTGTNNADSFTVDGSNAASSYGIAFTGVSSINALDGSDSVIGADGADWTLTGTSKEAINSGITFSAVESLTAVNANLLGTSGTDAFVLQSDGDVEAYDLSVSGMSAVDGNGGDDSLDASAYSDGLALTGTNNQVTAGSLTFDGIVSAITAALTGTNNADSFTVDGSNAASSYGIAFTGVSSINALDGSDSVIGADGADWTLTGTSKEAINSGITFSKVESLTAVNANLLGTSGTDAFVLQSDGDVEAYDLSVSGMSAVDGNGGDDSLDASAYSDGLALTGTNNQVSAGSLTFDGIVSAITAALTGTSGDDAFVITGSNALDVADISFSGLSSVDAGTGTDSVAALGVVTLTGNSQEATTSLIAFSGIEAVSGGSLEASDADDTFEITGLNALTANDIAFSSISSVDAKGGSDSVIGADGADWTLTGTSKQASNSGITFSEVESLTAVNANLLGTSGTDAFVLQSDGDVEAYDLSVSGMSSVDGNGGDDSLDASAYSDSLALTGTNNQVSAGSLTFDGIVSAITAALTGTSGDDAFVITGSNALDVADISFSGLSSVDAGTGTDSVAALGVVTLTGNSQEATTSLIAFSGIEAVSGGSLEASDADDTFEITGLNALTANDIAFSSISSVDAKGGSDSVIGADGADWTLTGNSNEASNSGITFYEVESLTAVNANLLGTSGTDAFVLQSDGDVEAYNLSVSGMSAVDGNGGDDSLDASTYSDGLALTGTNNQVTAGSLTLDGIVSAITAALTGTNNADSFTVDGSNAASSYGIAFTGVSSINALDGSDSVIGADGADWTLTGTSKEAINSGITFSAVESLTAVNANLLGTSGTDAFVLQSDGDVEAYDLSVSGMSAVDGNGGDDSLDASAYSDGLALTGTNNQVTAGSLTLDGIVSAITAALTGTNNADSFTVDGSNAASSYGIAFTGVSSINALDGSDSVIGADGADWTLTGNSKQASNSGITFSEVESLTAVNANLLGTSGTDAFVLQSDGDVEAYDLSVSGMSSVDGNGGDDSLDASAYSDSLALTGTNNQVSAGSLTFDGIVSAITAALTGTSGDDAFVITGSNALDVADISFSGLSSVDAGTGTDSVAALGVVTLTGNSQEATTSLIAFSGIEAVSGGSLEASDADDTFEITGLNALTANDIAFSSISSVDAKGGSDSVIGADGADWTLTGNSNEASNSGITFYEVESLTAVNANLLGTSGTDAFVLQSDGDVEAYNLSVSGMSAVDGNGGDDSLDASTYSDGLALTGTNNQVTAGSLTFDGIVSAITAALTGTNNADSFTVDGSNAASSYGIAFTGVSSINALDGSDSVIGADGADWTLTGTSKEAINSGITFSAVESLTAVNANLLGTSGTDAFVLQSDGDVEAYDLSVSGMSAVDGNGGDDSLDASAYSDGLALTGTNNQVTAGSLTFDGIVSAITAALTGTNNADSFTVDGSNAASSYGIAFTGVSSINALDGSDSVIGADGADWTLTGTSKEAINSGITFSKVESLTAVNANLLGTSGTDAFVLQSDGDVEAYDLSVSGMSAVDGNGGDDSLDASAYSDGLALTGTNNQVSAGSLTFDGIVSAITAALTGTNNADSFTVDGSNAASSYGIAFTGVSSINALDGSDSVVGADGADWTLTGTSKEAINSGITFSAVESLTAVNANLLGTSGTDAFVLQSDGDVEAYDLSVSGMSSVDGNGGDDSLDASAYSDGLALTGTNNQVSAGSLTFDGIVSAITAALTGTSGDDAFVITGSNALDVADISFSGLSSVDAGTGTDSVAALGVVTLTGNSQEATTSLIAFSGIEAVSGGSLEASDADDTFEITGLNALTANDIAFSSISSVDAKGGSDSVIGADGADWTLTGTSKQASNSGITFSEVESLTAVNANLLGTSGTDAFVLQSDGDVEAYDLSVSGMSSVDGNGGDDSLDASAYSDSLALTGTNNQVSAGSLTFDGIVSAITAALTGTSGDDAFVITGSNALDVADISFSGLSSVDAGTGTDSVAALGVVTLTGNSQEATTSLIAFSGIEAVSGGSLEASDADDTFEITGLNALTANDIAFSSISSVDAKGGSDSVIGADGADWTLTGNSNEASNSGITFYEVESLTAVNANLLGTSGTDAFVLQSDGDVEAYNLSVSGMSAVDGNGGDDSLDASTYSDGLALTGTNNQVTAGSLTLDGIVSAITAALTGTNNADSFTVDGSNAASSYGIAFTGVSSINALDGSDSVIGADGADWTLTGTSKEAINSGITFSAVESLTAVNANLLGTSGTDAFVLQSDGDVEAYDLSVSGMSAVDGNGGDDSLDASTYSDGLALTGTNNQVTAGSLTFDGIVSAITAALTGTNNADSFTVDGSNAASSYGIAFTGVSSINALDGSDSVIGADGADWTLTGTSKEAINSGITFSKVESLTAVNANLFGTSGTDAFVLQSDGDVEAYDLSVSGMSSVDGNGGDDSLDASAYSDGLALTGSNNQVSAGSLTFDGIVSAITAALTGTNNADSFTVDGSNAASSYGIAFTGVSSINALDGSDSVIGADGADWTLTGTSKEAINSGITFSEVESLTAVNANLLGTSGTDAFVLQSDGDVEAYDLSVSGMSSVDGNGGDDSLDASAYSDGLALTGTNNQVSAGSLTFDGIVSAITAALTGTNNADSFTVDGSNAASSYGIAFTGVSSINALDGSDSVVGADGADWTLTGTSKEAVNSGITFSAVESLTAVNANLLGTSGTDAFVLQSDGDVEAYDLSVSGMSAVDGNGGDDSLDASAYSDGLALTGTNNQVSAGSLTFDGIVSAITAALTGTSNADSFTVDGSNAASSYGIAFTGVSSINALDGSDSVVGADGADWTLTGTSKEAINSGITFSAVESLTAVNANLMGTSGTDAFVLQSDGDVEAYDLSVSGMSAVDGNGGDDSLDASAYSDGLALTGTNNQVTAGSLTFDGIVSAITAALTGTNNADSFTVDGSNAASSYGIAFTGVSSINALDGSDSVIGADGADWTLTGTSKEAINSGITFSAVESLTAVNANLLGSGGADAFILQSDGDVEAYEMVVSGMSAVDGQGGSNSLDAASYFDGLALTGIDNQVSAGSLIFDGIFTASAGALLGTSNADSFVVDDSNAVTTYGISINGVSEIDAGEGSDSVAGASGADWALVGNDYEAINSSITFTNIENLTVNNADLLGTGNADVFTLQSDGDVNAYGMTVSGMSAVDGNGGEDSLDASAYSDGLALTETENQLVAGSLIFSGIYRANTPVLINTNDSALFELQGVQSLKTAGINFSGLETVNTSGEGSSLLGTEENDDFVLDSAGDISVAGIHFTGLKTIDGAGGNDSVSSEGAVWTSTSSNNSLVNGGAEALVNNLTVVFENLELVQSTGAYEGQDVSGQYVFSALDTMTIGGVTFEGLTSLTAGSESDVIYGADIDAEWTISGSQQSVSSAGETLIFSGVESIFAGGGVDQFTLSGGVLTEIDTGAGDDSVLLAGTTIDTVSLGAGDDYVQVDSENAQDMQLSGGSGNDYFQYNLSGATWQINSDGNQVGNFKFEAFEYLDNTDGSLKLETDLGFDFVNGGDNSKSFNQSGAGLVFAIDGMRLGYDGEGDINITSSSSDTIGGSLKANRAELIVAGDVNIEVEVNTLAIATAGADIDISVLSHGDLVIDEINAGRGNVELASSNFGILTAETYGNTHITASTVKLGTDTELWTIIGESVNPLRLDVSDTLDIYSISYYEPDFIGQVPTVTSTGDELQSIAGSQASQGLKSAVQNAVEDFTQVDPAIFSAVKPYSSGVDAVNSPEMRLRSGKLSPSTASAGDEPVSGAEFDAVLDEEISEAPADVFNETKPFAGSAGG